MEHDKNFMCAADYIIDIGPDAGTRGGLKIYEGGFQEFLKCRDSRTVPYLSEGRGFPVKNTFRPAGKKELILSHANIHNLKDVTVCLPLGIMVGVAGVSGSGKSSLISDTLVPKLKEALKSKCVTDEESRDTADFEVIPDTVSAYSRDIRPTELANSKLLRCCYVIDQRPIGRSRTSCPATYTGMFDRIRALFAGTESAVKRGWTAGMFSVNSTGGCRRCKGDGFIHYHVGFGNFIDITCDSCGGSGYVPEVMEVLLDGKNIREVLEMSVEEARDFFERKDEHICRLLDILQRVGMGYIRLGQATPTISGGKSQRIKLAKELAKGKNTKDALYILDEPTTGLSFSDSERLLQLLDELVRQGASVLVTEHDPFILSNCDYIIEMGPEGGTAGGSVIAQGTPAELRVNPDSVIGKYL